MNDRTQSGVSRQAIIAVVLLAAIVRFALLVAGPWSDINRAIVGDSPRYILLGENLLRYRTFGKQVEDGLMHLAVARLREGNGTLPPPDVNGLRPEAFRTPVYPLFLAAIRVVTEDLRFALIVQCILGSLAAGMLIGIASGLGLSNRWSIAAGVVWALQPGLVTFDNLILTESLFNVLSVTALWVAVRTRTLGGLTVVGLLLGTAGLIRPLGLLYLPAVIAVAWPTSRPRWAMVACVLLSSLTPTLLWCARNQTVGEGFRITTVGDLNCLFYSAAYAVSEERGEDWLTSWPKRVEENETVLRNRLSPGEDVIQAARRLAFEEMGKRPVLTAKVHVKSQVKLMVDHSMLDATHILGKPYTPTGVFSRFVLGEGKGSTPVNVGQVIVPMAWTGANAILAVLAFLGFAASLVRKQWRLFIVCAVSVAMFMAATGCVGLERFRLPLMLPLILSAMSLFGARSNSRQFSSVNRV